MDRNSFEKGLDSFLAGDLEKDQLEKLEEYACTSSAATSEFEQIKQFKKSLEEIASQYREQRCPVDLSKEVMAEVESRKAPVFFRFRLAYAACFVLILVAAYYHFTFQGQGKKVIWRSTVTSLSYISSGLSLFKQKNQQEIDSLSLSSLMSRTASPKETSFHFPIPSRPVFEGLHIIKNEKNERS